ncbi:MAG: DUF3422 domain-containing protein [Pseudomonadota bacterium]
MTTGALTDVPDRYALSNELHARPFPELTAPCRAVFVAIMPPEGGDRDREADRAHLIQLLDRHGAPHPAPGANHHTVTLGRGALKWEQHTEFVTYTIFADGVADTPFDGQIWALFPRDWLANAPGQVLTSCLVRVERAEDWEEVEARLQDDVPKWFVAESLAVSGVVDRCALIASDFRIDENGHVRFLVLAKGSTGSRRLGRIVQRLMEIETYKSASMLTLPVARQISRRVATLNRELSELVGRMARQDGSDVETLNGLLRMAAEIELLLTSSAFRFGAAGAYEAIVSQRIEVLREQRVASRQTFAEFMMRRYDPAMRTCRSSKARLEELSNRAEQASNLLRTRVDVASAVQNAEVLRRMDERAALQLRLQETVEGLSVVAISYYAVNLAVNVVKPVGAQVGVAEVAVYALLTPPIIFLVWAAVRRIRRRIDARRSE